MKRAPIVSVIIPVRNRAARLRRALASVLAQDMPDFEILVVDDASSDRPDRVAESFGDPRVRVLRLDVNLGPSGARNAGLAEARGAIAAFLDSDDEWLAGKLSRQLARMSAPGGPDAHVGAVIQRDGTGERVRPGRPKPADERIASYLYLRNGFAQASGMTIVADLARTAGFAPELRQYEDHLFLIRAEALGARIEVGDAPMSVQHVDARADRLGARDDAARALAFLASADGLLTRAERNGFALRCLGAALAREDPAAARRLALRALAGRAARLGPAARFEGGRIGGGPLAGAALKLLLRAGAGDRTYLRLRQAARLMPPSARRTG